MYADILGPHTEQHCICVCVCVCVIDREREREREREKVCVCVFCEREKGWGFLGYFLLNSVCN